MNQRLGIECGSCQLSACSQNILLNADGHLLITDFGLSKVNHSLWSSLRPEPLMQLDVTCFSGDGDEFGTRAESMVGTKEYVAPEVCAPSLAAAWSRLVLRSCSTNHMVKL